ncbi:MAG: DNA-directed RNA polymerase subunit omega [Planctomycetota bacterium]|nr:DNA-directed RNA polymerase subunit omega [Planctomycetota bacterium]MCZ6699637.1 DNA-directed RNA polymerase subunit omega [Planctomycetota bacterium]MCZ6816846.1 DNA-directed RNA polymerase subunit omega [Planctomycetota bacterium]
MLDALKNEDVINRIGGRFKLTRLIQKRWRDLLFGARPLIEPGNMTLLEIAVSEIDQGKIGIDYEKSQCKPPGP